MKSVTKLSSIMSHELHAGCRLFACVLVLLMCGLSLPEQSQAALGIDAEDAGVADEHAVITDTVAIEEVMTIPEFAMIMAEAGLDPSLIGYNDPFQCILCLLTHPYNPEVCDSVCEGIG